MHHTTAAALALTMLAGPLAAQVVVVAPPPPVQDSLSVTDPYGACLPQLGPGASGCKPNPFYKPDYTIGTYNAGALHQQNAAAAQTSELALALAKLEAEVEALRLARLGADLQAVGAAAQQDAQRAALGAVIQAQRNLEQQYRATWPRWETHWREVAPRIEHAAASLLGEVGAGRVERGCGGYVAFQDDLRLAIPPAPGNIIGPLHSALYDLRQLCLADDKAVRAVAEGADRVRTEVGQVGEWSAGRSAYYAALVP